jgi:hypothetical protein
MSDTGKFTISLPDNLNNYKENQILVKINDEKKILRKKETSNNIFELKNNSLKKLKKSRSQSQFFSSKKFSINLKQNDLIISNQCEKIKMEKDTSDTDSGLFSAAEESTTTTTIDPFRLELIKKAQEMSNTRNLNKINTDELETKNRNRSFTITNHNKRTSLPRVKSNRFCLAYQTNEDSKQTNLNNSNESEFSKSIRFEMPSLIEINELTSTNINMPVINEQSITQNETNNSPEETELNNLTNNNTAPVINLTNNEPNTKAQILTSLEYLMNNSKSNVFNTTVAIANIAAAAAASESNLITSDTEAALQNFFMDLVIPNVDLNNNASNETNDLALIWHQQHLAENSSSNCLNNNNNNINSNNNNNNDGTSAIQELNSSVYNLNNNMNNKQTNEQIMRTCMGYLDYINKKHIKERRTQIIRNKISGFVLLTLVFLLVLSLGLIMIYCLTDALAHIIKTHKNRSSSINDNNNNNYNNNNNKEMPNNNNKSMLSPLVHLNLISNQNVFNPLIKITNETKFKQDDLNSVIRGELKYEIKNFALKLIDKMTRNLEINLKEEENNITQIGSIMFNLTVVALTSSNLQQQDESGSDSDEPTELHYFRYIDEIN